MVVRISHFVAKMFRRLRLRHHHILLPLICCSSSSSCTPPQISYPCIYILSFLADLNILQRTRLCHAVFPLLLLHPHPPSPLRSILPPNPPPSLHRNRTSHQPRLRSRRRRPKHRVRPSARAASVTNCNTMIRYRAFAEALQSAAGDDGTAGRAFAV